MATTGLSGRSVVVPRAAGDTGRAAAPRSGAEGTKVLVADPNTEGARSGVTGVEAVGGTALAVRADLNDRTVLDEVVAGTAGTSGGLEVPVGDAHVMDGMTAAPGVTHAERERVPRVDLTAWLPLTRAVLPYGLAASPQGAWPSSTRAPGGPRATARRAPSTPPPSTSSPGSPGPPR